MSLCFGSRSMWRWLYSRTSCTARRCRSGVKGHKMSNRRNATQQNQRDKNQHKKNVFFICTRDTAQFCITHQISNPMSTKGVATPAPPTGCTGTHPLRCQTQGFDPPKSPPPPPCLKSLESFSSPPEPWPGDKYIRGCLAT